MPRSNYLAKNRASQTPLAGCVAPTPPGEIAAIQREPRDETGSSQFFPIVGIGASAGGLAAFEGFFSGMPPDTDSGMAFVLVQHLAPDHKSILSELIRRCTHMQVFEVEDGMAVRPNCAYIIPPNRDMAFLGGTLQLIEPSAPRGQRLPIDFFFRSLALDQHERGICVVLSGTGSGGTQGVRAIKGEGGMAMAQNPDSTEYDGMPRSAIETGLVDYELLPAEMPAQLIAYATRAFGRPAGLGPILPPRVESAMKKVFVLLRAQTGHDFSQYKPGTIRRRIERRLAVHQIESLESYVKHLRQTPAEVDALFRDLLIGVTSFFRDPDAFTALEQQVVPMLLDGKPASAAVRVWSPACSTGEEAYSIAMLLQERLDVLTQGHRVQLFATDIDNHAIATARTGLYSTSSVADLSPERLSRFFSAEADGTAYRIHKDIRDMLIFSEQDVITDPPFSKLDLISCRNLLIYLGGDLQKKLIPLFHYALNPGGILMLGTSETVGDGGDLFTTLDRKAKIYQRNDDYHGAHRAAFGRFLSPVAGLTETASPTAPQRDDSCRNAATSTGNRPLRDLTEQALLQQFAPAGALVNDRGDIFYLHGRTGMYLEPSPGEPGINNILKMARAGLRRALTTALHKTATTKQAVRCTGLHVKTIGGFATVNLIVSPVTGRPASIQAPLYLVVLKETDASARSTALGAPVVADGPDCARPSASRPKARTAGRVDTSTARSRLAGLERESRAEQEYLQSANEELENSNEELKSSNDGMQSVNEELQSANEELETSREELQSVNEELATVNAELQTKVADLSRANNDMNNLLAGTGIATVFVDRQLRILRFTPAATGMINLIPSDVGRSVGHIVSNLVGYDCLVDDVEAVLDTLIPREMELQTRAGGWCTLRIQPYRTLDNVIEGAVMTFVDVPPGKRPPAELAARDSDFGRLAEVASASDGGAR